jgi:hypothetical protein
MRKILLATTALVAVSGVTAANADISISGNYEFEYVSGASNTVGSDGNVVIEANIADAGGVNYSWVGNLTAGNDQSAFEETYIAISSDDMGTLYLGDLNDSVNGLMDGNLGINNDIESENATAGTSTVIATQTVGVSFVSPSIAGLKFGISADPAAETTEYAINYSMAGMSLYYGGTETQTAVGVKGSLAGFTVAVGSSSTDGSQEKASDVAVKYSLPNGITVAALSAKGTDSSGNKVTYTNFGASYSIADGVTAKVESGDGTGGEYTTVNLSVSF